MTDKFDTSVRQPIPSQFQESAAAVFGQRLVLAERYASILVTRGVQWGLIGPREAPRIWERHLLNCAVLAELIPPNAAVIDIGSGAGLPGIVLAITRPDLRITLVESLLRRTRFLTEVIAELDLASQVRVIRGRAEELRGTLSAPVVTARAVAPLVRLIEWCVPLTAPGGQLLAIKGESALTEVQTVQEMPQRKIINSIRVRSCGKGVIDPPITVVEVTGR